MSDPKKDDLETKLLEDIKKTGFPLELRVAGELLKHGYFAEHNLYYIDKDEQKGREIEISALKNSQNRPREKVPQWVRNRLLVECKKAQQEKPWVIFTSPVTYYDSYPKTITQTGLSDPDKLDADTIASVSAYHPYWLNPRRGRSFYEAFKGPDTSGSPNTIFRGLMSVVKATIAKMDEEGPASPTGNVVFYHPLIVVDGRLCDAYLNEKNEIILRREMWIPISFAYRSPKYENRRFTVVVVEETHLPELLKALDDTLDAWALLFDAQPALASHRSR